MKRKLTIQVRRIRHVCTLQNTCRPHVIKTIKRHYVHIWIFLAGTFGARKKWLRLVEKGLDSQARTMATPNQWMARARIASSALFAIWKLNWRTYPCLSKRLCQQQWKTGLTYSRVAMEQLGRWFCWVYWLQLARWLERALYRSSPRMKKWGIFSLLWSPLQVLGKHLRAI